MGWCGGSELADKMWDLMGKYVPKNQQKRVARKLIDIFEQEDCDTMSECRGIMKAAGAALNENGYPIYDDDTGELTFK